MYEKINSQILHYYFYIILYVKEKLKECTVLNSINTIKIRYNQNIITSLQLQKKERNVLWMSRNILNDQLLKTMRTSIDKRKMRLIEAKFKILFMYIQKVDKIKSLFKVKTQQKILLLE